MGVVRRIQEHTEMHCTIVSNVYPYSTHYTPIAILLLKMRPSLWDLNIAQNTARP